MALGRWFNMDPLCESFSDISPYVFSLNTPTFFVDPDGRDIKNADEERRKKAETEYEDARKTKKSKAKYLGISPDSSRRIFRRAAKAKGKKEWERTKDILNSVKTAKKQLNLLTELALETQDKIEAFSREAPNMFKVMDNIKNEYGETVDVMMGTKSMTTQNGKTEFIFVKNDNGEIRVKTQEFGVNTLTVTINRTMEEGYYGIDTPTTLETVKHEMGHASYYIEKTSTYYLYIRNLFKNGRKVNGGHNNDDKSGKRAKLWETKKDL